MGGDGELDEGGWIDLRERLAAMGLDPEATEQLIDVLTARLVGHFGVEIVDCWLGKNGTSRHAMREVAAASIAHLGDAIDPAAAAALAEAPDPPWNDSWRDDPRTASWRS